MELSDDLELIAFNRGYESAEQMIEVTKLDPTKIDPEDPTTWPPYVVLRTIMVQMIARHGFTIVEGERHNIGMGWDEMLGHLAAMTIPKTLADRGRIYPMTTDQEDMEEERRRKLRRKEREQEDQINQQNTPS